MILKQQDLACYLSDLLQPGQFKDYCPNGLQVAGSQYIRRIITGVTACQQLLGQAIEQQADAVIVHHGYFWKGEDPCIVGIKQLRLKSLLENNINLFAYHLPLDLHAELGNNVQLAQKLGWQIVGELPMGKAPSYALMGRLSMPMLAQQFEKHLSDVLGRQSLFINGHQRPIETIAWCTGAAQDFIEDAARAGVDAYVSGEISERTVHLARELGIHYFAAGHHATERYGIQALTTHLAQHFGGQLELIKFIDITNPV